MKLLPTTVLKCRRELLSLLLLCGGMGAMLVVGCSDSSRPTAAATPAAESAAAPASAPVTAPATASTATRAATTGEPWTESQLMEPAELAKILSDPAAKKPYVIDIGTPSIVRGGKIKDSIVIGPGYDPKNLEKLRATVSAYPKDADVVIYCGCCPFRDCPNIRPAFKVLQEMKLTRAKLLNIPTTLKADWVAKGYPSEK